MINIIETTGYKSSVKAIKTNYESLDKLDTIKSFILANENVDKMKSNPLSHTYGYEELKDDLTGYCKYSLCKNSSTGKVRLIFSVVDNETIRFEYVSNDHYHDFKRYLRRGGGRGVIHKV